MIVVAYLLWARHPLPALFAKLRTRTLFMLVRCEAIKHENTIKNLILPHELKQEHKTCLIILKVLKVTHEQFTWSGDEIPHIDRYGGHIY